ncbi:MAG: peroxidase-related enzyme [Saprospiraceae bacterium]|uniref:Peroxidase-related enzyme n=1 Tax=Candidatus Opimibacter skivensis TaxID=2982028 RepID=A0A9D7XML6_9BACT|nr:peroxidase-related enzyme [Candidatus Opimibacter skivensis]
MPYIETNNSIPGIRGLMQFRPDAALALNKLAQVVLADDASLSKSERELIATFVSAGNECKFCMTSHAAIVSHLPEFGDDVISAVRNDYRSAPISDKLKALLNIADKVRVSGRNVSESDIEQARQQGASDMDIHDTVLIAAMFCMMNRYVDGLGATTPDDPAFYAIVGKQRAEEGYLTKSVLVKD